MEGTGLAFFAKDRFRERDRLDMGEPAADNDYMDVTIAIVR